MPYFAKICCCWTKTATKDVDRRSDLSGVIADSELADLARPSEINLELEVTIARWESAIEEYRNEENDFIDQGHTVVENNSIAIQLRQQPQQYLSHSNPQVRGLAKKLINIFALEKRLGLDHQQGFNKGFDIKKNASESATANPMHPPESNLIDISERISFKWADRLSAIDPHNACGDKSQLFAAVFQPRQSNPLRIKRIRPKWPDHLVDLQFEVLKVNSVGKRLQRTMKLTEFHVMNIKNLGGAISKVHRYMDISSIALDSSTVLKICMKDGVELMYLSPIAGHIVQQMSTRVRTRLALEKTLISGPTQGLQYSQAAVAGLISAISAENSADSSSAMASFALELGANAVRITEKSSEEATNGRLPGKLQEDILVHLNESTEGVAELMEMNSAQILEGDLPNSYGTKTSPAEVGKAASFLPPTNLSALLSTKDCIATPSTAVSGVHQDTAGDEGNKKRRAIIEEDGSLEQGGGCLGEDEKRDNRPSNEIKREPQEERKSKHAPDSLSDSGLGEERMEELGTATTAEIQAEIGMDGRHPTGSDGDAAGPTSGTAGVGDDARPTVPSNGEVESATTGTFPAESPGTGTGEGAIGAAESACLGTDAGDQTVGKRGDENVVTCEVDAHLLISISSELIANPVFLSVAPEQSPVVACDSVGTKGGHSENGSGSGATESPGDSSMPVSASQIKSIEQTISESNATASSTVSNSDAVGTEMHSAAVAVSVDNNGAGPSLSVTQKVPRLFGFVEGTKEYILQEEVREILHDPATNEGSTRLAFIEAFMDGNKTLPDLRSFIDGMHEYILSNRGLALGALLTAPNWPEPPPTGPPRDTRQDATSGRPSSSMDDGTTTGASSFVSERPRNSSSESIAVSESASASPSRYTNRTSGPSESSRLSNTNTNTNTRGGSETSFANSMVLHGGRRLVEEVQSLSVLEEAEIATLAFVVFAVVEESMVVPLSEMINLMLPASKKSNREKTFLRKMKALSSRKQHDWGIAPQFESPLEWQNAVFELTTLEHNIAPCTQLMTLSRTAKAIYAEFKLVVLPKLIEAGKLDVHLGADDLVPIFLYVLSRSGLQQPILTNERMWALCHPGQLSRECGYYLTVFESCLDYIENENVDVSTESELSDSSADSTEGSRYRSVTRTGVDWLRGRNRAATKISF